MHAAKGSESEAANPTDAPEDIVALASVPQSVPSNEWVLEAESNDAPQDFQLLLPSEEGCQQDVPQAPEAPAPTVFSDGSPKVPAVPSWQAVLPPMADEVMSTSEIELTPVVAFNMEEVDEASNSGAIIAEWAPVQIPPNKKQIRAALRMSREVNSGPCQTANASCALRAASGSPCAAARVVDDGKLKDSGKLALEDQSTCAPTGFEEAEETTSSGDDYIEYSAFGMESVGELEGVEYMGPLIPMLPSVPCADEVQPIAVNPEGQSMVNCFIVGMPSPPPEHANQILPQIQQQPGNAVMCVLGQTALQLQEGHPSQEQMVPPAPEAPPPAIVSTSTPEAPSWKAMAEPDEAEQVEESSSEKGGVAVLMLSDLLPENEMPPTAAGGSSHCSQTCWIEIGNEAMPDAQFLPWNPTSSDCIAPTWWEHSDESEAFSNSWGSATKVWNPEDVGPTPWDSVSPGESEIPGSMPRDWVSSWLTASGLPSGECLAQMLNAMAPEAYED